MADHAALRFDDIRPHLDAASQNNLKAGTVIRRGLEKVDEGRLLLVRIDDYDAHGLIGNPNTLRWILRREPNRFDHRAGGLLSGFVQPLSGEYAGRRSLLETVPFVEGWGVEFGLLVDVVERPQRLGRQALVGIQSGGADGRQDSHLDVARRIVRCQTRHE